MSVTLKVNDSKQTIETHKVQSGQTLVIDAKDSVNYQLINNKTGYAPQNIIVSRDGNDLVLHLEDTDLPVVLTKDAHDAPAAIIKGYYAQPGANPLVGLLEDGALYAYVPQSGLAAESVAALATEMTAAQALGGTALGGAAALWTFNPWWLIGGLALVGAGVAIAAGSKGGKGGDAPATTPTTPPADNVADSPVITTDPNTNTTTVTPGTDNNKVTTSYTDTNGNPVTVIVVKDSTTGEWTPVDKDGNPTTTPTGVTVDPTTGKTTVDNNVVDPNTPVTSTGDSEGKTSSPPVTPTEGQPTATDPEPTPEPTPDEDDSKRVPSEPRWEGGAVYFDDTVKAGDIIQVIEIYPYGEYPIIERRPITPEEAEAGIITVPNHVPQGADIVISITTPSGKTNASMTVDDDNIVETIDGPAYIDNDVEAESVSLVYTGIETELVGGDSAQDELQVDFQGEFSLSLVQNVEIIDLTSAYSTTLIDVNAETVAPNAAYIELEQGNWVNAVIIEGNAEDTVDIADEALATKAEVQYQGETYNAYNLGDVNVLINPEIEVI